MGPLFFKKHINMMPLHHLLYTAITRWDSSRNFAFKERPNFTKTRIQVHVYKIEQNLGFFKE